MSEQRTAQKPLILAFLKFVVSDFYDSDVGLFVWFFLTSRQELKWRTRTIRVLVCRNFFFRFAEHFFLNWNYAMWHKTKFFIPSQVCFFPSCLMCQINGHVRYARAY